MLDLENDPRCYFVPDAVTSSELYEIEAPASIVWEILMDLPRYPEWNPFCVRAESTMEMGAAFNMCLRDYASGGGRIVQHVEYICALEPERRVAWGMGWADEWPYPARRDQIIEPLGPDRCRYHSTDAFLGPNGIHVYRFAGPWVKHAFDDSALALKARAERFYKERNG